VKKPLGIGLLSGGLDSALACLLLRDAGADVQCLHFFTGFCVTGHNSRVGRKDRPIANHALQVAEEMGVPVELVDIADDYLPMVMRPKHGYGRNMNPCVDCRIFMLERAKRRMEELGADFVFTGEVIGQRPKSQLKKSLNTIEEEVGLRGRLLRPLSARLLQPTDVEKAGRVDRSKLLDLHGRGRKVQFRLAQHYGISNYMSPAGGCCFLTDKSYSSKLQDLVKHDGHDAVTPDDVFVLGVGRHFRLSGHTKVIVGRDETENNFLRFYQRDHWAARVVGHTGPTAIITGEMTDDDASTIASVVARYSGGRGEDSVEVRFEMGDAVKSLVVPPASDEVVERYRI